MRKEVTTKERLASIESTQEAIMEDIKECKENLNNHLQHHFWFTITLIGACGAEAIGLIVLVLKLL
jgi:hypothetical protein